MQQHFPTQASSIPGALSASDPTPTPGYRSAAGPTLCGGAFANMEMDVVLRTVLRHFTIDTTTSSGEKWHSRGVAFTPKNGGRIVVHRRNT